MEPTNRVVTPAQGFSAWKAGQPVRPGSGAMVESADWVIRSLPKIGVNVSAGSRLLLARRLLGRVHARDIKLDPGDLPTLKRVADAQRTVTEFFIILRAMQNRRVPLISELLDKLTLMLGGSDLEDSDTKSLARDTQFELYVMAQFIMGGATVKLGEPDLRLLFGTDMIGVAIKRLSSRKQLRKRVLDAADQIESRGGRGFIAVNLDRFVSSVGGPTEAESLENRGREYNKNIAELHELLPLFAERPQILGILNFGFSAHWDFNGEIPRHSAGFFRQVLRFTDSQEEIDHANRYFETLSARIQNELQQL
jgi:hypothetical protein